MKPIQPQDVVLTWARPPGGILQRELDARGLSQAELAARTNLSPKHVNQLVKGLVPLSPEVAIALEQVLGVDAETWLRQEGTYQAHEARQAREKTLGSHVEWASQFPRKLLLEHGVINPADTGEKVVDKLLRFFEVSDPKGFARSRQPQASFKRSQAHSIDPYLTVLWLRLAEVAADQLPEAEPFDSGALKKVVPELVRLSQLPIDQGFRRAQKLLRGVGVTLVYLPEITKTRIAGASWWINSNRPLIAVTSRQKWHDSLWFAVLHEVGHLLLHSKRETFIDFQTSAVADDELELEANKFAQDALVPPRYRARLTEVEEADEVIAIAEELGVSPGVVVGQYSFLTDDWASFHQLRTKGDLIID